MEQISARRLLLALWFLGTFAAGVGMFGAGSTYAATETDTDPSTNVTDSAARFQQLDAEVEQILDEVVTLGAEMAVLKEARELSPNTQLLVLVSIEPSAFFQLDAIQFQLDEQTAAFHQYSEKELNALSQGGSHRLFWGDVPAGRHKLTALLIGRVPKDPDFQREAEMVIVSGMGRRVVELSIASGKKQTFPEFSIKEWK